jgi:Zn-dependent protease with chaperone function
LPCRTPANDGHIKVSVPQINAANAGGGEFYVTTGLLEKASDDRLRGVLAHEVAHADLGHVAKAQTLGTGMNIGIIILARTYRGPMNHARL